MCGRSVFSAKAKFAWQATPSFGFAREPMTLGPRSTVPVITAHAVSRTMQWGFSLDHHVAYNAREESLTNTTLWRERLQHRVVLAVWQFREGKGWFKYNQPDTDIAVAGLADFETNQVVMVTCAAQGIVAQYHQRQPLMLTSERAYESWLDNAEQFYTQGDFDDLAHCPQTTHLVTV